MATKKDALQQSTYEKYEGRFKSYVYLIMHELLQAQVTSSLFYNLLLLIEAIQLIWYSIHPNLAFLWTTEAITYIRYALRYFQFDYLLTSGSSAFFVVILFVVFGIQVLVVLMKLLITCQIVYNKKKTSTFVSYSVKFLSLYAVLLQTVLTIPFAEVFYTAFYCTSNDYVHGGMACYSGIYFLYLAIGIVGFILFMGLQILYSMLYADINPASTIPFASPQSRVGILKFLLKLGLPLYFILDYQANYTKYYIAIVGIVWLFFLGLRLRAPPYYDDSVFTVLIGLEAVLFWFAAVANIHAFLDLDATVSNIGLFYAIVAAPFMAYVYYKIAERLKWRIMRMDIKNMKDYDYELFVSNLLKLIDKREKPEQRIILEGILKLYLKNSLRREEENTALLLAKDMMKEEETPEKAKVWYNLVRGILLEAFDKFSKSNRLHLLYAYVLQEKLKNKYKALFELMKVKDHKPNLLEDFSIYRYKNVIEEEMIESDIRSTESKGMDVNIIVHFQNRFVEFQSAIEKSVLFHLDFWRELLEDNPDIQKLQGLGSKITNNVESTSVMFKKLNEMNPNNIKCLQIYGNFLKDIVNDDTEGQRILEKAEYVDKSSLVNKQFIDNERLKYGENSNTCIATCSGNFNTMGLVLNINNEITRILGYSKSEIIGGNITRIQPRVYADLHDGIMKKYFDSSEGKVFGEERIVFPVTKAGYVVPCSLMVKILPNLDDGIKIVGFLKDIDASTTFMKSDFENDERVHYIMYGGENSEVFGITFSCYQSYGITHSLVSGGNLSNNQFTIESIIPDFGNHAIEDLKSPSGVILTIDTSNLQQNFLLGNAESVNESDYKEDGDEDSQSLEKQNRYKKAKIRAVMIQDMLYGDVNLRVLKFVEVNDDEDIKKSRSYAKEGEEKEKEVEQQKERETAQEGDDNNNHNHNKSHEDGAQSERSSNHSGGSSINDDMRALKDTKLAISEKTVPKSIKILRRTAILAMLIIIGLAASSFGVRSGHESDITTGISAIQYAYQRVTILADVVFYVRKLDLLATGYVLDTTPPSLESTIKANLITLINNLQSDQFNVIKVNLAVPSDSNTTNYTIYNLRADGTNQTQATIYDNALFQFITSASSVANSTLSTFNSSSVDSTLVNFFYVNYNGLRPLRWGAENIAMDFYSYYMDRTNVYESTIEAFMIVGLCVVIMTMSTIVPFVFSVQKTNNRVLSLFGFIPIKDINLLADKCEKYLDTYLEDRDGRHDLSFDASQDEERDEGEEDQPEGEEENAELDASAEKSQPSFNAGTPGEILYSSAMNVSQATEGNGIENKVALYKDTTKKGGLDSDNTARPMKDSNKGQLAQSLQVPEGRINNSKMANSRMERSKISSTNKLERSQSQTRKEGKLNNSKAELNVSVQKSNNASTLKEKLKPEDLLNQKALEDKAEKEQEDYLEKSAKLLNSKDNNRVKTVLQFSFFALLYMAYFCIDFGTEVLYVTNVRNAYIHYRQILERPANLKFVNVFTQEEIALSAPVNIAGNETVVWYTSEVYAVEQNISTTDSGFPSQFNDYNTLFQEINLNNTCDFITSDSDCATIGGGILEKGLSQAVVYIVEENRDLINQYMLTSPNNYTVIQNTLNGTQFLTSENMITYTDLGMNALISSFITCFTNYLSYAYNTEIIKFAIFMLYMLTVFVLIWIPYLRKLSQNIWRTKGMLNMIPMDIMSKNENLKGVFMSPDLLQAVK